MLMDKIDPRSKTIVDPDVVWVELDGPRGRGLGYYKKNSPKLETARAHPKVQKAMKDSLVDPFLAEGYPLDKKVCSVAKDDKKTYSVNINPQFNQDGT